jgi:anti-anti-sigma regulatory factor
MALNFKLSLHETSGSVHLILSGDFGGNSAHELIKAIQEHASQSNQVIVHTEYLNHIDSFGIDVFKNNIRNISRLSDKLIFVGKNRNRLNSKIIDSEERIVPLETNGGTRLGIDRRQYTYSAHIPERRSFIDRRCKNITDGNVIKKRKNYIGHKASLQTKAL